MKQILRCVIDRGGSVRLDDVPMPVCNENEIIVSNKYSLISIGTEIQMAKMDTAGAVSTTLKDDKMKNTIFKMFKSMKLVDFLNPLILYFDLLKIPKIVLKTYQCF